MYYFSSYESNIRWILKKKKKMAVMRKRISLALRLVPKVRTRIKWNTLKRNRFWLNIRNFLTIKSYLTTKWAALWVGSFPITEVPKWLDRNLSGVLYKNFAHLGLNSSSASFYVTKINCINFPKPQYSNT